MVSIKKLASALVVSVMTVSVGLSSSVFAHITVKPEQVPANSYQTFTVSVPNERETPTSDIKILIPKGVESVTPTQKPGWTVNVKKTGTGEDAITTSITWSGGQVKAGFRDDFSFSAKTPAETADIQWKTYQTYEGGVLVSWDQDEANADKVENKGPFSVTKLTPAEEDSHGGASTHKEGSNSISSTALAASAIAIGMSGVALVLSLKKR